MADGREGGRGRQGQTGGTVGMLLAPVAVATDATTDVRRLNALLLHAATLCFGVD